MNFTHPWCVKVHIRPIWVSIDFNPCNGSMSRQAPCGSTTGPFSISFIAPGGRSTARGPGVSLPKWRSLHPQEMRNRKPMWFGRQKDSSQDVDQDLSSENEPGFDQQNVAQQTTRCAHRPRCGGITLLRGSGWGQRSGSPPAKRLYSGAADHQDDRKSPDPRAAKRPLHSIGSRSRIVSRGRP